MSAFHEGGSSQWAARLRLAAPTQVPALVRPLRRQSESHAHRRVAGRAGSGGSAAVDDWLPAAIRETISMTHLQNDWHPAGHASPSTTAIVHALGVLRRLHQARWRPLEVAPSAGEGVGILLGAPERYAVIDCYNDGDVILGLVSQKTETRVHEVDLSDFEAVLRRMGEFLGRRD